VSGNNDPYMNSGLIKYPVDANGIPLTYTLEKKPYIEASIGCSNIFRIMRLDVVKRFTYLNNPNAPSIGVRVQIRLDL
jgi:hypothetical protein